MDQNKTALARGKEMKNNNSEAEACSSSPCNVALVTASNLSKDALYLPQDTDIQRCRDSSSQIQNRFVTKLTYDSQKRCRLGLPLAFMKQNGMDNPGQITLLAKDGTAMKINLLKDSNGRMRLGQGWREFVLANRLQIGESFTLEASWKDATPILKLYSMQSTKEDTNNIKGKYNTSNQNHRVATLRLTPEDVQDCNLILPIQFLKANGINEIGKINFTGQDNTQWWGYLASRDGTVAVGIGWKNFCESNGIKIGDLFTLEYIYVENDTIPVLKLCPNSRD